MAREVEGTPVLSVEDVREARPDLDDTLMVAVFSVRNTEGVTETATVGGNGFVVGVCPESRVYTVEDWEVVEGDDGD